METEHTKNQHKLLCKLECTANLGQAAMLNFVEGHIWCWNYFCRIAIFGENILTEAELLALEDFQYCSFDLDLWTNK